MDDKQVDSDILDLWGAQKDSLIVAGEKEGIKLPSRSRLPAERFRRRLLWDSLFKLLLVTALPVAWPLLSNWGRTPFIIGGVLSLSLVLGIWQLIWVLSWPPISMDHNLQRQLVELLQRWKGRRYFLAFLLGSTPALVWQLHQIAYYAVSKGRFEPKDLVAWLFAVAGGPFLWLFSSWVSLSRVNRWLLQIERALSSFLDEESRRQLAESNRQVRLRGFLLAAFLAMILIFGLLLLLKSP